MKDEVVIYWTGINFDFLVPRIDHALLDLVALTHGMNKESPSKFSSQIKQCPAVTDYLRNTFRVKNNVRYDLTQTDDGFYSEQKDKNFFDEYVMIRDKDSGMLSLNFPQYIFFTEEESLIMEFKHPSYANNNFSNNTQVLEGSYDIGKWFRNIDLSFFIKSKNVKINLEYEDVIFYIRFLTEKKVVLKRFKMSPELESIRVQILKNRQIMSDNFKNSFLKGLSKFYYTFYQSQYKTKIIKEIKNNLLEQK